MLIDAKFCLLCQNRRSYVAIAIQMQISAVAKRAGINQSLIWHLRKLKTNHSVAFEVILCFTSHLQSAQVRPLRRPKLRKSRQALL